MKKIQYGDHCFGPYVNVDGESLFVEDGEFYPELDKKAEEAKMKLFKELESLLPELDMMNWRSIAEIVTSRGRWEYDEKNSRQDTCDQCGNYNYDETFTKLDPKENI